MSKNALSIILISIVLIGIPLFIVAISLGFNPFVSASPTETPKDLIISNLTANSATLSFFTPAAATDAIVKYGTTADNLSLTVADRRDLNSGSSGNYFSHIFDLTNLSPNTTYFYAIIIGGHQYLNGGAPFQTKTLPLSDTIAVPQPNYGRIAPAEDSTLIYTHAVNGSTTSTTALSIIAQNGTFTFDMGALKDKQTGEQFALTGAHLITFAQSPSGKKGATMYAADSRPGEIIISETFTQSYNNNLTSVTSVNTTATPSPSSGATQTPTTAFTITPTVTTSVTPEGIVKDLVLNTYSSGEELKDATAPYEIFISDITPSSFTLNWRTNEPTTGTVIMEMPAKTVFLDSRDASVNSLKQRYTHRVTITPATSSDAVTFKISSNNKDYYYKNNTLYSFSLPDVTSSAPLPESAEGTVIINYTEKNDRDLLIYFRKVSGTSKTSWKSQTLSDKSFALATGDLYRSDLAEYFSGSYALEIYARGEYNSASTIQLTDTTIPAQITLGPGLSLDSLRQGATINVLSSLSGTAPAGSQVSVAINGQNHTTQATSAGLWALTGVNGLFAGENILSLSSGGSVMGITFAVDLEQLPSTPISDQFPLILALGLIGCGILLRRHCRHYAL